MAENRGAVSARSTGKQVVELVRGGRSARWRAREFAPSEQTIRKGAVCVTPPQNRPGAAQTGGQTVRQPPGQGNKLAGGLRRP